MLHLFQADSGWFRSNVELDQLLARLPKSMHSRALRYRFEADAFHFALGRLLLKEGLKRFGMAHQLEHISIHENGKPSLAGVYFNISHSSDLVVCALTKEGELGIDVERIAPVELNNFREFFAAEEWPRITRARDPLATFYHYWTRKESILKALGITLARLHQIEVDSTKDFFMWEGKKWHLKELNYWEGYSAAVCSEASVNRIELNYFPKIISE